MTGLLDSETYWLTVTNIGLGLVVLICVVAVGSVAAKEIFARVLSRNRVPLAEDTHAFNLADLGITMADGGTRIDESSPLAGHDSDDQNDPPNIFRSNN